ncbi:FUSC family protein [Streptosporangium carneum]|uniref:Membrane protein n=1 Tax=Streptosporangium carneum TaxID=47481 RepID=A0A9W6MDN8_9ACTN|nr:FUSC family protein [Streptosporangium carneum]GLK10120.1 membrane protein [Streptosporangium carneum]
MGAGAASGWLGRALRPKKAPIAWAAGLRAGTGIAAGVATGVVVGDPRVGMLLATGALAAAIQDRHPSYRLRFVYITVAVLGGAAGTVIGVLFHALGWWTVAAFVGTALVSGVISAIGPAFSAAGMNMLVTASMWSALPLHASWWWPPLLYLAGGATVLALTLAAWPVRAGTAERAAVARVYREIAAVLDEGDAAHAWAVLPPVIGDAHDVLAGHRLSMPDRDSESVWLMGMLNAVQPLLEATESMLRRGERPPPRARAAVRAVAEAVASGTREVRLPRWRPVTAGERDFDRALAYAVVCLRGDAEPPAGRPGRRWRRTLPGVLTSPGTWGYALRLALCMGIAAALVSVVRVPHSYWVLMTVTLVLKPDFGSVFVRAVLRALGTLAGVVVGGVLLLLVPLGWPTVPVVFALGALARIGFDRSNAMMSTAITPLILILAESAAPAPLRQVLPARLFDTLLGCAIVLIAGYALWPRSWRVRVRDRLADTVTAAERYLETAFEAGQETRTPHEVYRRFSSLNTIFQQALSEPPPASTRTAAWWPEVVAVQRITDAVAEAAVQVRQGAPPPSAADLAAVEARLRALASVVRREPAEKDAPGGALPETGPLSGVAAEVRTAWAALPGGRSPR